METYHSELIGCFIWELLETSYRCTNQTSWTRTTGTSWWHTTETSLDVSFETCLRRRQNVPLRRCHDILIRHCGDVPLRRLGNVSLRLRWVFHLRRTCDVAGRHRETSLRRRHDALLPGGNGRTSYAKYARVPRSQLPGNVIMKRKCKRRAAPKSRRKRSVRKGQRD